MNAEWVQFFIIRPNYSISKVESMEIKMVTLNFDYGWKCWTVCFVAFFLNMILDGASNSFSVIMKVVCSHELPKADFSIEYPHCYGRSWMINLWMVVKIR